MNPISICSRCEFADKPGTCRGTCNCLADPLKPVDITISSKGVCPKGYFDGSWKEPVKPKTAIPLGRKFPFARQLTKEQLAERQERAVDREVKRGCGCTRK